MTDDPVPAMTPTPETEPPPERERVGATAAARKFDALPALYLLGFLVLAGAVIYLYRHPTTAPDAVQETDRSSALRQQVAALEARLSQVESRPAPAPVTVPAPVPPPAPDLGPLETRIAALETRPSPPAPAPVDLGTIERRIAGLEQRPAPPPPDLSPVTSRLDALAAKQAADATSASQRAAAAEGKNTEAANALAARLDRLEPQLAAVQGQAQATAQALAATTSRAQRAARMQEAVVALNAGQPLGDIPQAPPALARFARTAPPTEASLRLSFDAAAQSAQAAATPADASDKPFAARMWSRAQQVVTVRQGDSVLLGDASAGVLARARAALDAGDLEGAVGALDALAPPVKAAMAGWTGPARALLEARAALAGMGAG